MTEAADRTAATAIGKHRPDQDVGQFVDGGADTGRPMSPSVQSHDGLGGPVGEACGTVAPAPCPPRAVRCRARRVARSSRARHGRCRARGPRRRRRSGRGSAASARPGRSAMPRRRRAPGRCRATARPTPRPARGAAAGGAAARGPRAAGHAATWCSPPTSTTRSPMAPDRVAVADHQDGGAGSRAMSLIDSQDTASRARRDGPWARREAAPAPREPNARARPSR